MDQMFAQCAAPFKVSTKVVWGLSDLRLFVLSACALLPPDTFREQNCGVLTVNRMMVVICVEADVFYFIPKLFLFHLIFTGNMFPLLTPSYLLFRPSVCVQDLLEAFQ